jgi:dTDP-4-amino-4,6-dideoxygalactose transaminase
VTALDPIPQFDLRRALYDLADELGETQRRLAAAGMFVLGEELEAFEAEFAAYCATGHAVGVASGTDALELTLRAAGIGPGDEVITAAHTFIATPLSISSAGAVPVFVDVREQDGLIDPEAVRAAISPRTAAIIPVHLYGRCADMTAIRSLADQHGLLVIEDAAQAHGARHRGRPAGGLGLAGCFSFYPSKNLGALGDGGAVVTDDDELARSLRLLRNYGQDRKYHHVTVGRNSRLDEIHAAVLRLRLPRLNRGNAARLRIARRYREAVDSGPERMLACGEGDAVHQAVVCAGDRPGLAAHLAAHGVQTAVHYPLPCHRQPVYSENTPRVALPVTDRLADTVLSLPMFPELTDEQVERVCAALTAWNGDG